MNSSAASVFGLVVSALVFFGSQVVLTAAEAGFVVVAGGLMIAVVGLVSAPSGWIASARVSMTSARGLMTSPSVLVVARTGFVASTNVSAGEAGGLSASVDGWVVVAGGFVVAGVVLLTSVSGLIGAGCGLSRARAGNANGRCVAIRPARDPSRGVAGLGGGAAFVREVSQERPVEGVVCAVSFDRKRDDTGTRLRARGDNRYSFIWFAPSRNRT